MLKALRDLIEAIHATPHGAVLICTGGGARGIEWLLSVPGASATVLEATVPYSSASLEALVGALPGKATSVETAAAMADAAYRRARQWSADPDRPVLGVACTAALATNYPKRGDHRVALAIRKADDRMTAEVTLTKGARTRSREEDVASRIVVVALAEACGITGRLPLGLRRDEELHVVREDLASPMTRLLRGDLARLVVLSDGQMLPDGRPDAALLPGAFNPLHEGHRRLAAVASALLSRSVAYEISVENVDKPPLSEAEVSRRLRQFEGLATVVLTRAPTFRRKVEALPGATFVIGYDTLERLFAPRYYGGEAEMNTALAEIRAAGAHFLVAGRRHGDRFLGLPDFSLPSAYQDQFTAIPEHQFRSDLSSTAIRAERTREG